jgi:hypothetical protein
LDIEKAFDSVEHGAITHVLKHAKVPKKLVSAVEDALTESYIKVSTNGANTNEIKLGRGKKQGDPISPTLFVLVMEALSRAIQECKELKGVTAHGQRVKTLMFADDTAVFLSDPQEERALLNILDNFQKATGLKINTNKSAALSSNPLPTRFSFAHSAQERYLGYQVSADGIVDQTDQLAASLASCLSSWKHPHQSPVDRAMILNTYALPKLWFQASLIPNTEKLAKKVTKLQRWYLWSGDAEVSEKNTKNKMNDKRTRMPTSMEAWHYAILKSTCWPSRQLRLRDVCTIRAQHRSW